MTCFKFKRPILIFSTYILTVRTTTTMLLRSTVQYCTVCVCVKCFKTFIFYVATYKFCHFIFRLVSHTHYYSDGRLQ